VSWKRFVQAVGALILGTFSVLLLAEDAPRPDGIGPMTSGSAINPFTLGIFCGTDKAASEIMYTYTRLRPVAEAREGQDGARVKTIRLVAETRSANIPLARLGIFDAKGDRLTFDAFLGRVKKGDVIVVYEGSRLPAPQYLRIFRDDTLILVHADRNPASIPADPKPPAAYKPYPR
jgi:hypothetical protein